MLEIDLFNGSEKAYYFLNTASRHKMQEADNFQLAVGEQMKGFIEVVSYNVTESQLLNWVTQATVIDVKE